MKNITLKLQLFIYQRMKIVTTSLMLFISKTSFAQGQNEVSTTLEKGIIEILNAITTIILLVGVGILGIGWMIKSYSNDDQHKETGQKVMKGSLALFAGAALVFGAKVLTAWLKTLAGADTY